MSKQTSSRQKTLGTFGKDVATKFLEEHSYTIVARNFATLKVAELFG